VIAQTPHTIKKKYDRNSNLIPFSGVPLLQYEADGAIFTSRISQTLTLVYVLGPQSYKAAFYCAIGGYIS